MNVHVSDNHPSQSAVSAAPSRAGNWRQHLSVLLPLLLVYLALACYRIDAQSLWLDEVFSVRDATSSARFLQKSHGPLHFALLHVWMNLGTSELVLRTLSVLVGAVALCLFYATSLVLVSRRVTIVGTILCATSPFLIWYSQEVRYVISMLATSLLMIYTFQRLTARARPGRWLAYGSAIILAFASFVTNIFLLLAQGLYLLWSASHRPLLRKWLICLMLVCMPLGWWIGSRFLQRALVATTVGGQQRLSVDPTRLVSGNPKAFTPVVIPYTFLAFSTGFSQGPSVRELHVSRSLAALAPHAPTLFIIGVLFGGLFLVGLMTIWRQPDVGRFLTLWIGVPIVGVLGVSTLTNMAYNVRYVAMVWPAYVLVLAAGIVRFRRPAVQMTLLATVLLVNGWSLANYYFDPRYAREDARSAARYLEAAAQARDVILVVGAPAPLRYYYQGNLPIISLGKVHKTKQPVAERLRELDKDHDRLWLVEIRPWQHDPRGTVKAALDNAYDLLEHQHQPGVDIYAYQLSR